jgi:hypothetical protein
MTDGTWAASAAGAVLVLPGCFFDLDVGATLVLSLIVEEHFFAEGLEHLLAIGGIQSLAAAGLRIKWLEQAAQICHWAFPGFSRLRTAASVAVLHVPIFDWQSILVALVLLLLAAAYALFRCIDF